MKIENIELNPVAEQWLPPGKFAAVCFSIDDIHPATASDAYEAGGDLLKGRLRYLDWLLERHPELRATLFVTADWRATLPTRDVEAEPAILAKGTMRLGRHPEFVNFLRTLPRTEIGLHGLDHVGAAAPWHIEFLGRGLTETKDRIAEMLSIFQEAGLPHANGMTPPGWFMGPELAQALIESGIHFAASARDIITPIAGDCVAGMSGLTGVSLIYPQWICGKRLLHFTTNFQATSELQRANDIIEAGGLLAVKAHIVKRAGSYVALDGLDEAYCSYLDCLFDQLESYGDGIWWTSMGEIAARCVAQRDSLPRTELSAC